MIAENGLFCLALRRSASHYWHTPEAGGGVDKDNPTQVGRALAQRIELIAAYSPQARGRSERMFGTCRSACPRSWRLAGIATMAEANRFIEELFWPAHNARFARPAADTGSAFVAFAGTLEDILCAQEDRVVAGDNTVRYKNRTLQIPADRHRHHYVKAQVRVHEYPDGHLAVFHGPRCLARYRADGGNHRRRQAPGRVTRFDATEPGPVDKWSARQSSRPDHLSTGPTTTTEAVNSYGTLKRSTQFVIDRAIARNRNLQLGSSLPNVRIHDPEFASCTSALRRRVGEWRRLGYENAADNLERFLKGVGGTKTITREEARRFPVIREAEAKARHRFEGTSFF